MSHDSTHDGLRAMQASFCAIRLQQACGIAQSLRRNNDSVLGGFCGSNQLATSTIGPKRPDLSARKLVPGATQYHNGDTVEWQLSATNGANLGTTGPTIGLVTITDTLDPRLSFIAAGSDPRCHAMLQVVLCADAGPLTAGSQLTFTISTRIAADAAAVGTSIFIVNRIVVATAAELNTSDNTDAAGVTVLGVAPPDLRAEKALVSPSTRRNGDTVEWDLRVSNAASAGPTSSGIMATDTLDPRLAFVPVGSDPRCHAALQVVTCSVPRLLLPGSIIVFRIATRIADDAAGFDETVRIVNRFTVTTPDEVRTSDNTGVAEVSVRGLPRPDLRARKVLDGPGTRRNGETVTWQLRVSSHAGPTTGATTVTDTLDPRLTFVAAASDARCHAVSQVVTCTAAGALPPVNDLIFRIATRIADNAAGLNQRVRIDNSFRVSTPDEVRTFDNTAFAYVSVNGPN